MDRTIEMGTKPIGPLLIKFALPSIASTVVQGIYNIVDRIFVGNAVGSLGLASITSAFPLMIIGMAVGMLFGIGGSTACSIALGQQNRKEANHFMGNAFALMIIGGLISILPRVIFIDQILILLKTDPQVMEGARSYLMIVLWGEMIGHITYGMNNFIRVQGKPRVAMVSMLIGAFSNIILDYLFVMKWGMGVAGAAWATVIGQFISGIWVMSFICSKKSILHLKWKFIKPHMESIKRILHLGVAPFSMQLIAAMVVSLLNWQLARYGGSDALAILGISFSVCNVVLMPIYGISQGMQPLVGYNFGARIYSRVREALRSASIFATIVITSGFFVIQIFPGFFISLFGLGGSSIDQDAIRSLRILSMMFPVVGCAVTFSDYFMATGRSFRAMFLGALRQMIFLIPLILILPMFWGVDGVWFSMPIADLLAFIVTAAFICVDMIRLRKLPDEPLLITPDDDITGAHGVQDFNPIATVD